MIKTIYNSNLREPDSYTVECGGKERMFDKSDAKKIGEWIKSLWEGEFFPSPAYIYYNIDWDSDHVLYCKYEKDGCNWR